VTPGIAAGEFVAIAGWSGSGKSTLLRTMAGFWPALSGRVVIEGVASLSRMPNAHQAGDGRLV
jgi:ABC-type Fe3+/spermidine/putrescine transport system ATPase subunit